MKKILFLVAFCGCNTAAFAQNTNYYSYYNDHKFWDTDDVIGYTFVPNEREVQGGKPTKLRAGEVVFRVMRDYLYVTEGGNEAKYSVNQITSEAFGMKMQLMDARNPTIQGHVKIIRDENRFVRAVIFKKSGQEKEVIYHQAEPSLAQERQNSKYFTHKDSIMLRDRDAFWKKNRAPIFFS